MLVAAVPLWAYDFEVDGIYYDIKSDGRHVYVTHDGSRNGGCYSGSVTIPYSVTYEGRTYYVDAIFNEAFWNCTNLGTVSVKANLTYIGPRAFYNCTSLWKLYLENPTYLKTISQEAFYNCSGFNFVGLASGLSYVTEIGWDAFYGTGWYNNQKDGILYLSVDGNTICYGYKGAEPTGTLTIKDGTTLIADWAFNGCSGITDVIIPSSIKYVGARAFDGTSWDSNQNGILYSGDICLGTWGSSAYIEGDLVIKEGTTKIISNAFLNAEISSLTIPNSVTEIDSNAFGGCWLLTRVTIEDGTTDLSGAMFNDSPLETIYLGRNSDFSPSATNCPTIKNVTIGNSLTSIGSNTFYNCTGLTEITIPNSVTSIGSSAFYNCTGLTDVTIGNSVTYIGSGAFDGTGYYNNCSDGEFVYVDNCLVGFKGDPYAYNGGYLYRNKTQIIKEGTRLVSLDGASMRSLSPTEIISLSATPPILSTLGSYYEEYKDRIGMLYVPADAYNAYWMSETWSAVFSNIKPLTVVSTISVEAPSTCVLGDSIQLNAVVMPNNATKPDVKWSSSDPDVASVDATGLLKYLKEGKTTITATATDGSDVSTSFDIEVKAIKATSIALDNKKVIVNVNDNTTLSATIAPEDVTVKAVEWSVSDEGLLSLIDNGNGTATVTQLAEGTAYVYVRTTDGTNLADTCEMTTFRPVESIVLDPVTATVGLYETATITATVYPENANNKDLNWTISDSSIGMLKKGANGTASVVLKAEGTVTVTATAADGSGATAICVVSTDVLATNIELSQTDASLMIGETLTLNYTITPADAVNKEVQWRSNNEKVATVSVDANGTATVTAIAAGEAIVSLFTVDGTNIIADCHITVARGEDAPNVVTLTINECEGGNVEIAVTEGETIDLAVNAMYGWKINSVAFNGEDVTADFIAGELFTTPAIVEDSELVIAYVKQSTGEEEVSLNATNVKVYGYDNVINIKGAEMGSVANVFDTDGVMIYSGIERSIPVANDGVYIVVVEGHTFKLAL